MIDYNKIRKENEEKCKKNMKLSANGALIISYLATFILIIIWLFKLLLNAKNEPQNRVEYINKDFQITILKENFVLIFAKNLL